MTQKEIKAPIEPKYFMEAANGMWVWVPKSKLASWQAAQDKIRREGFTPDPEVSKRIADAITKREAPPQKETTPSPPPPAPASTNDKDEPRESYSRQEYHIAIVTIRLACFIAGLAIVYAYGTPAAWWGHLIACLVAGPLAGAIISLVIMLATNLYFIDASPKRKEIWLYLIVVALVLIRMLLA